MNAPTGKSLITAKASHRPDSDAARRLIRDENDDLAFYLNNDKPPKVFASWIAEPLEREPEPTAAISHDRFAHLSIRPKAQSNRVTNWLRAAIRLLPIPLLSMLFLSIPPARAQLVRETFTTKAVWLRAGPSVSYPSVTSLRGHTWVTVNGCLSDWSWCDVSSEQARGWVARGYLSRFYPTWQRPPSGLGSHTDIPVITFSRDDYWSRYYSDQPWYRDRVLWMNRPRPHHHAAQPPVLLPSAPAPRPQPPASPPHGSPPHGAPRPPSSGGSESNPSGQN